MNKLLIAVAAAFLAVTTLFASNADAGFNIRIGGAPSEFSTVQKAGCGHGGRYFHRSLRASSRQSSYLAKKRRLKAAAIARARAKAKARAVAAARAKARAVAAAKAEAKANAETDQEIANADSSSISGADNEVSDSDEPVKTVAAARELGCKQFFASVSMTLSVPCQ